MNALTYGDYLGIATQWLQECLKSVGIYTDKGATNDNSSSK